MHTYLLSDKPHEGLILLFSGWGTGFGPFRNLRKEGYDILLIEDYRDFTPELLEKRISELADERSKATGDGSTAWEEVIVVAWSFGVRAATEFLRETHLNVTLRLAVNGTPQHIDDLRGIPATIFHGTLEGLNERNLKKFLLRTAGTRDLFELRLGDADTSEAAVENLREELILFRDWPVASEDSQHIWDKALVSENDRIFPPENQLRAWDQTDVFTLHGEAHLPDFQRIITEYIVRKDRVATKFGTTRESYSENATAQQETARELFKRLKQFAVQKLFPASAFPISEKLNILEIGQGDGTFTRLYFPWLQPHTARLVLADISGRAYRPSPRESKGTEIETFTGDVEAVSFKRNVLGVNRLAGADESIGSIRKYDLILSASALQWLNSPATMLRKCAAALRPGGLLALAFYGEGTLEELTAAGGTGLKYPSAERLRTVAERSGMATLCTDSQKITLRFPTPLEALRHMNLTGVNALPTESDATRTRNILRNWPRDERGEATLTFVPRYLIFKKL